LIFVKGKLRKFKDMYKFNILIHANEEIEKPPSTLCEGGVRHYLPKAIEHLTFDIPMVDSAT
jgi:hypothetical protein